MSVLMHKTTLIHLHTLLSPFCKHTRVAECLNPPLVDIQTNTFTFPKGPLWPSHRVHLHRPINTHACFNAQSLHRCLSILTCYLGQTSIKQSDMFWSQSAAIHQGRTFINLTTRYESISHVFKHFSWVNMQSSDLHSRTSKTIITKTHLGKAKAFLLLT